MDVITAHVYGIPNAVAPLGTAFTNEHGKLIKRFVEDVVMVFDSDQAGIKAAKKAADILLESGLNVNMLIFPAKEDPDSFLRKHGKKAFQKLLNDFSGAFEREDFAKVTRLMDEHFGESNYSLKSLFHDQQRRILDRILESTVKAWTVRVCGGV